MIKYICKHFRKIVKGFAFLLILWGLGFAAFWYFYVIPKYRRIDPVWEAMSYQDYWWKIRERDIIRYGWLHGDGWDVGAHGDRHWVERIMKYLSNGGKFDKYLCCFRKRDIALQLLTCQDPTVKKYLADEDEWLSWWKGNCDKSQIDWIREGLAKYGAKVDAPASEKDYVPLLTILGKANESGDTDSVPDYVVYNAYRWLRDSDFDPVAFALDCDRDSTPEVVRQGLSIYYERFSFDANVGKAGVLPLREGYVGFDISDCERPPLFSEKWQFIFHSLMIGPTILGIGLLWIVRKRRGVLAKDETSAIE